MLVAQHDQRGYRVPAKCTVHHGQPRALHPLGATGWQHRAAECNVSRAFRLAGEYVWATVINHEQRMVIYQKRAVDQAACKVKEFKYALHRAVLPLATRFRGISYHRELDTML